MSVFFDHKNFLPIIAAFFGTLCCMGCGNSKTSSSGSINNPKAALTYSETADASSQLLSDVARSYVWDIEHFGFVLEATVFPKLKASLNDGSLSYWSECLPDDCQTRIIDGDKQKPNSIANGTATFTSVSADSNKPLNQDRKTFLHWLADTRSKYSECRSSIGLVRLTPENKDFTGKWSSVWRLRLAGENKSGPVETEIDFQVTLNSLDDKIADRQDWCEAIGVVSFQHMQAQQKLFTETTESSQLASDSRYDNWKQNAFVPNTGGVYVSDYDQDGILDVFVDDHTDGNRLYRGNGDGTFVDTTAQAGIDPGSKSRSWALSCWADLDNDGDDDLIVEDKLYENLGNGKFADITSQTNFPLTPASSYAVGDFNLDGLLDVYVCHAGAYRVGQQERTQIKWVDDGLGIDNVLLRNLGSWQFEDVTEAMNAGANGSSCFTAIWLHANDDNLPDLFAINEFGVNTLLLNSDGTHFEAKTVDPVFGGFSMGAATGDFNNDGRTDIYVANMYSKAGNRILANIDPTTYPSNLYHKIEEGTRGSKLYEASADGAFLTVPAKNMFANVGWAYGPAFVDFDNDGWLDIYATAGFKSEERGKPDG